MAVKCGCLLQVITGRGGTLRAENLSLLDMLKIQKHIINTTMLLKSEVKGFMPYTNPENVLCSHSLCTYLPQLQKCGG